MKGFRSLLAKLFLVGAVVASSPRAAFAEEPSPGGPPSEPSVQVEPSPEQPPAPEPNPPPTNISAAPVPKPPAPAPSAVPAPTAESGERIVPTSPPREPRFGDAGQLVLDGALSASFGHLGFSAGGSTTSFNIQPAFDYFAAPNVSLGVSALLRYADSEPSTSGGYNFVGTKTLTLGLTAAVGFDAWVGDRVSFWPRLSLDVWRSRETLSELAPGYGAQVALVAQPETQTVVVVELFAPFLFHLTPHFFVGFGPDLYADLHNNTLDGVANKRRFVGAESTLGGWF